MLDLIWNLFQDHDIDRLRSDIAQRDTRSAASHEQAGSVEKRLLELERRHEQLKLVTLSLWRLLKDRAELSDAALEKYVSSTDLIDRKADGKVDLAKELIECHGCHRYHLNTAIVCPYCGARNTRGRSFDTA